MRTQTPSFVVKAKLHLQNNVKAHLNKSFHIADSAYNETLNHGLKHFSAMKKNLRYQELLELRRDVVKTKDDIKKKIKKKQTRPLRIHSKPKLKK